MTTLHLSEMHAGGTTIEVEESFDQVLDKVIPLTQPSSSLEARQTATYTRAGTDERVYVPPPLVAWFE